MMSIAQPAIGVARVGTDNKRRRRERNHEKGSNGHGDGIVIRDDVWRGAQAQDKADWCKSKWGPDDEIGAANHIKPDTVLAAAKLVKTGKTYSLGGETNAKTPAFAPRSWATIVLQPGQVGGMTLGGTKTSYNDDIYMGWVGTGSQIDGLGHLGIDNVYYNCNKSADFAKANGLTKLGIEKMPPLVARGVVLDMTAVTGKDPVPEGTAFNKKEIDAALEKQGIQIQKGDVVLFHTGWMSSRRQG